MSHFVVMVIGDNWEEQLEKYDENLEIPKYIKYTKEQHIAKEKAWIKNYEQTTYAGYLEDPSDYKLNASDSHFEFISMDFPNRLTWTDEQIWADILLKYAEDDRMDEQGNLWSEYNPDAKWDWYVMGGRWSGMLRVKSEAEATIGLPGVFRNPENDGYDQAEKGDILNLSEIIPFAIVKDGVWFEKGEMGWWGMTANEMDSNLWSSKVNELLEGLEDDVIITVVDCHI